MDDCYYSIISPNSQYGIWLGAVTVSAGTVRALAPSGNENVADVVQGGAAYTAKHENGVERVPLGVQR
jgi:hypothetical protein